MKRDAISQTRLLRDSEEHRARKPFAVFVDGNITRQVDEAIEVLRTDANIFERGGALVRLRRLAADQKKRGVARSAGSVTIAPYPAAALRERLLQDTHFFRLVQDDPPGPGQNGIIHEVPCPIPPDLVSTLRARAEWPGIRPLEGVVQAPTLRGDGSILQAPGYDAASALVSIRETMRFQRFRRRRLDEKR